MHPIFQDTQPAPLHQLSGKAQDEFRVDHPTEQLALLRQLADTTVLVHLSAPGGASYTTTLWTVDGTQRRESFRVRTPANAAPSATFRHPAEPELLLALRVLDVSVGGCALALPPGVPALAAGSTLAGVRLELDADARFEATLALQHISGGMGSARAGQRLGCAFAKLDGGAQRTLQRYINQTQKRQRQFSLG